MSKHHYFALHKLLTQLPLYPVTTQVKRPGGRGRPRSGYNGIYFMYENDETINLDESFFERIVYVGINEVDGRLDDRLNAYARPKSTPLWWDIRAALAVDRGVEAETILEETVTEHITINFRYRRLKLPSARDAQVLERKIIPTLAKYSGEFSTKTWLGRQADFPHGIWNRGTLLRHGTSLPTTICTSYQVGGSRGGTGKMALK